MTETTRSNSPQPHYVEMRDPTGRLAFRYDPIRDMIETQHRGQKFYFDLALVRTERAKHVGTEAEDSRQAVHE